MTDFSDRPIPRSADPPTAPSCTCWHPQSATAHDAGASPWQQQAPYPTRFAVDGVDVVSSTEAWVVAYTDIRHTTDGGATCESQARPGTDNLYSADFFDGRHGIAVGNTTLYTREGGATWLQASGAFDYDVEMAGANLAFITSHTHGWIVERVSAPRTTDGVATWQAQALPPGSWVHDVVFSDASNGWGVGNNLVRTPNGGATWQEVPLVSEAVLRDARGAGRARQVDGDAGASSRGRQVGTFIDGCRRPRADRRGSRPTLCPFIASV